MQQTEESQAREAYCSKRSIMCTTSQNKTKLRITCLLSRLPVTSGNLLFFPTLVCVMNHDTFIVNAFLNYPARKSSHLKARENRVTRTRDASKKVTFVERETNSPAEYSCGHEVVKQGSWLFSRHKCSSLIHLPFLTFLLTLLG